MLKTALLLLTTFVLAFAQAQETSTLPGAAQRETSWRNPIGLQFTSAFFDLQGTQMASNGSYGFRDAYLLRQSLVASTSLTPNWLVNVVGAVSDNYVETYFYGVLYKDRTQGWNDTLLSAQYVQILGGGWTLLPEVGLSLPTGSIGKKNRENPGYNYPFNMQLGSGTFDVPLAVSAVRYGSLWVPFSRFQWTQHIGRNSQGYRLGDDYLAMVGMDFAKYKWLTPGVRGLFHQRDGLSGQDNTLGRIALLEYYYHTQINWDVTATVKSAWTLFDGSSAKLSFEGGVPLVQDLRNYDDVKLVMRYYAELNVSGQF